MYHYRTYFEAAVLGFIGVIGTRREHKKKKIKPPPGYRRGHTGRRCAVLARAVAVGSHC